MQRSGRLEDEDRIAAEFGAAAVTDVGGHVAHAHVAVLDVVLRDADAGVPAAQDKFDAGSDAIGVMRAVRVVHRHDVRDETGAVEAVVIGDRAGAAGTLDKKAGVTEKGHADLARLREPQRGRHDAGHRSGNRGEAPRRKRREGREQKQ